MLVKCQWCGKKSERDEMSKIKKGYIHPECLVKYEAEQEEKQREREQLDRLIKTIKQIHDIPAEIPLPNNFYPFLQDLRNGTIRFRGPVQKKRKQGVGYDVIEEAYCLAQKGIEWAKNNKNFEGSLINELKYGLAIVRDKLNQARNNLIKFQRTRTIKKDPMPIVERATEYKQKEYEKDITDYLEDDIIEQSNQCCRDVFPR